MERVPEPGTGADVIIDESFDPAPGPILLDSSRIEEYLHKISGLQAQVSVPFAAPSTRGRVAAALIDTMWRSGNFKLDDLHLTAKWTFNSDKVGDMAAFYASVEAAADYIDTMRLNLRRISLEQG
ncbi:MAG: hypothetical protein II031_03875, partial [Bacteroidales bacterium]|nr:hypothetical protein [Bacteroidales bacterium]